MWDNIGSKIKAVTKFFFWIGVIASVIGAIIFISIGEAYVGYGFLCLILGPFLAWISSLLTYGFGELIENSQISVIETQLNVLKQKLETNLITKKEYDKQRLLILQNTDDLSSDYDNDDQEPSDN